MPIPWELIVGFGVGLAMLFAMGSLLLTPGRLIWRMAASAMLGAVLLGALNLLGPLLDLTVPVNPLTALIAGALGLPGVALVVVVTLML